jgi:hypothetical protein
MGGVLAHYQGVENIESGALLGEKSEQVSVVVAALIAVSAAVEDVSEQMSAVVNRDHRRLSSRSTNPELTCPIVFRHREALLLSSNRLI